MPDEIIKTVNIRKDLSLNKLFYLEIVDELVETILFSGSVADEIPISIILVAIQGAAKSQVIKQFHHPSIHRSDSITQQGLFDLMKQDKEQRIKFITLPDFNPTLARKSSTANATIANLLTLTTDGVVRVDDGRGEKEVAHSPVGVITACTPEIYDRNAKHWFALGLRRRILPIFYTYTLTTELKLQQTVQDNGIHSTDIPNKLLRLPKVKQQVEIPSLESTSLRICSEKLAINLSKLSFFDKNIKRWTIRKVTPISPHIVIRNVAKSHALRDNRRIVNESDVQFANEFTGFTDPENVRQI